MATPVAGCNPVDGRGRGEPTRGKGLQLGMRKRPWLNSPRTGKSIKFNKKQNHLTVPFFLCTFSMLVLPTMAGNPHEPMVWKLYNFQESKLIQTQTGPGKWNFSVSITSLIPIEQFKENYGRGGPRRPPWCKV